MAQLFSSSCITYHDWILIVVALLLPFTWLKTMREISFVALFGLMASLLVAFVVVTVGLYQWIVNVDAGEVDTHQGFTSFGGQIQSFNLAIFSFLVQPVVSAIFPVLCRGNRPAIAIVTCVNVSYERKKSSDGQTSLLSIQLPTIEHSMAHPDAFPLVSDVSFMIITPVYVLVGLAGYAGWGDTLVASGNVLTRMSLSYGSSEDGAAASFLHILIKIVVAVITLHLVFAFPLPMNPINLNVETHILKLDRLEHSNRSKELLFRILSRTTIVALAVLVASVVPYFGDVLGILSAFAGASVAFILPPVFYYALWRKHGRNEGVVLSKLNLFFMALVACLGVCGMGVGMYYAVNGLVSDIRSNGNPFDNFFSACTSGSTSD